MQKFINIRTSQFSLTGQLKKFAAYGWKVIDVTKGSELSRFMFSMRWTITLENYAEDADEQVIDNIAEEITADSWKSQLIVFFGGMLACGLVCGLVCALCFGIPLILGKL